MTVKEALKQFSTGDLVAIAFLSTFIKEHPDQVKKLLEKHEASYSNNPLENFNKLVTLAGMRQRYFTDDLEDVAKEAHYFSLANIIDPIKGFIGKTADAVSTISAPVVTAMTGNPMLGSASTGVLQGVKNLFAKGDASAPPAPINTSPQAIQVADAVKKIVEEKEKEDDKPTFWQKYKWYVIGAVGVLLVVIAIMVYLHYKKKQKKVGQGN